MRNSLRLAAIVGGLAVGLSSVWVAVAQTPASNIDQRKALMRANNGANQQLGPIIRGERPWDQSVAVAQADILASNGGKIPALIYFIGTIEQEKYDAAQKPGAASLPGMHTNGYAPVPEPSIRTGVRTMSLAVMNLLRSPTGRAFVAIRDSEISASCMGVNLATYKTLSFALSAALAARYPQYRDQPFESVMVFRIIALYGWAATGTGYGDLNPRG